MALMRRGRRRRLPAEQGGFGMKWGWTAGIAAVALVACGGGAATNDAVEAAPSANSAEAPGDVAPPVDLAGARALIDRIYTPYARDEIPEPGDIYTPELNQAVERQSDPDMGLGYDPFCACQDFGQFSYTPTIEPAEGGATARVDISNFGERQTITLDLAHRDGRWLVADIRDANGSLLDRGR